MTGQRMKRDAACRHCDGQQLQTMLAIYYIGLYNSAKAFDSVVPYSYRETACAAERSGGANVDIKVKEQRKDLQSEVKCCRTDTA